MIPEEIIQRANEVFKEHKATLTEYDDGPRVLKWKKPGEYFYSCTYIQYENTITIFGDIGECIYKNPNVSLEWFASSEPGYLREKLVACSEQVSGKLGWLWSKDTIDIQLDQAVVDNLLDQEWVDRAKDYTYRYDEFVGHALEDPPEDLMTLAGLNLGEIHPRVLLQLEGSKRALTQIQESKDASK